MPSQANLTLNALTYTPSGRNGGVAGWANRDASSAFPRLATIAVSDKPNQDGNFIVTAKLVLPHVRADDSSCGCEGSLQGQQIWNLRGSIPASVANTANLLAGYTSLEDFVASAAFQAAAKSLEPSW